MASQIVEEYGDIRAAEALKQGIQQGIQQGEEKKAIEDAINFYADGASVELIAKSLKMSEEQVREIVNKTAAVND